MDIVREVPQIQTIEKIVEIPYIQTVEKIVEVPQAPCVRLTAKAVLGASAC